MPNARSLPLPLPCGRQASTLQSQVESLQSELEAAATRQTAAVEAALAAAEERVKLELRGQQLAYETRIQVRTRKEAVCEAAEGPPWYS